MNHIKIAEDYQTQLNVLPMRPGHIGTHGGRPNKGISYLAEKNDRSLRYISDHLAILEAPELHKDIATGKIPYTYIRAYLIVPVTCKKDMVAKFLAREFQTREAAMAVASALKHYPEKNTELLAINYKPLLTADKIKAVTAKVINPPLNSKATQEEKEKFISAKKFLLDFMLANHADSIFAYMPILNAPVELDELRGAVLAWGKNSSAKSLAKLVAITAKEAERQRQLPFKTGH